MIEGSNWSAPRDLQAAVCGGGSRAVSSDCDLAHAIGFSPTDDGRVDVPLTVTIPPTRCPCVVLVTQASPGAAERLPLTIVGSSMVPLPPSTPEVRPALTVSRVRVVSQDSWTSWFGAAARRELVLAVHNGSDVPVRPLVVATWDQGSDHYVVTSPRVRVLAAGATTQIAAPFALSTFAHGSFFVAGKVTGDGFDARFASTTSTNPWGLLVVAIALFVVVLFVFGLSVAQSISRRKTNRQAEPAGDGDTLRLESIESGVPS